MLADDEKHGAENRATMQSLARQVDARSASPPGAAMQPIWSQPAEKVVRFEDSLERSQRRFDDLVTAHRPQDKGPRRMSSTA